MTVSVVSIEIRSTRPTFFFHSALPPLKKKNIRVVPFGGWGGGAGAPPPLVRPSVLSVFNDPSDVRRTDDGRDGPTDVTVRRTSAQTSDRRPDRRPSDVRTDVRRTSAWISIDFLSILIKFLSISIKFV